MANPQFQDIPPHVSALGSAGSAVGRLASGGLLLVAVIAGLLVYGNRRDDAVEPPLQSRTESGGGVSLEAPGFSDQPTELLVRVAAPGATIHVDGDSVGAAPDWQGTVTEGERWVRIVTPAGRVVADTLVLVHAGTQAELDVRPLSMRAARPSPTEPPPPGGAPVAATARATGAVRVTSSPAGATVLVDGRPAGRTPLRVGNLLPGPHAVLVEREGYEATSLQVSVTAGSDSEVAVSLRAVQAADAPVRPSRPAPAPTPPAPSDARGTVEVLVRPWGRIVIDGVPRTQETDVLYRVSLPPGEHRIEALHPTLGSKATTVMVTGSGRVRVEFDLAADD